MTDIIKEGPSIVARAKSSGSITLKASTPAELRQDKRTYQKEWYRRQRAKFSALGLTAKGTKRIRKLRPELKGLKPKTAPYQKAYNAIRRKELKGT